MKHKWLYWCGLIILVFLAFPAEAGALEAVPTVSYRGHIQDLGDYPADGSWVDSPTIIGTVGQSKRIEGFEIKLTGNIPQGMALRYNVHVQNKGWLYAEDDVTDWPKDGAYAGTRGQSLRIEAVKLVLTDATGQVYPGYSVHYRGHVQNVGDLPADDSQWLADGTQLGTVGSSQRLEALQVTVVKKATDLSAYRALLKRVDETAATDYTVSSWAALQTAMADHVVAAEASQLTVNAAVTAIQAAFDGLVKKAEPQVYDQAGIFGSAEGSQTIAGDVVVAADGVVLNNLVIDGNLLLAESLGDGTVTLNNITVKGDTLVRGGGINSIHINGGDYSQIIMAKTASGAVRLVALDAAGLEVVIAEDAAGQTIILEGAFAGVTLNAPNMTVSTQGATTTIGNLTVGEEAGGTTLNLATGTTVGDLVLDGKATIKGQGIVARAQVKADGVVFEKKPAAYEVKPDLVVPPVFPSDGGGGGYTPPAPPAPVAVNGVSLPATLELGVYQNFRLAATLEPANATNQAVTFSSDDGCVQFMSFRNQTVDLYGNRPGTATITARTADGDKTANCLVTVRPFLNYDSDRSQLLAGTEGNFLCLSLSGDGFDGSTTWIVETNTTGLSLGTASNNMDGTWQLPLTGQAQAGSLTLRASHLGLMIDSTALTVNILPPTNSLAPTGVQDTSADFSFAAQTGASTVTLQQKLSIAPDATWAPATLAAPLDGQSTTARAIGLSPGVSYEFRLLVVGGATPGASNRVGLKTRVPVTGVSLDPADPLNLKFGQKVTLTATVAPANATDKTVNWSSSNPAVLRSDGDGSFTAVGIGFAIIMAKSKENANSATCEVKVAAPTAIRNQAITALSEPFAGWSPVESFEVMLADGTTREYSGTVAWTKTADGTGVTAFDGSTAYTARMTLSAAPGYQFAAGTSFAVAGADTATTVIGEYGLTATVTANYEVKDRYVITDQGVITVYSGPGGDLVIPGTIGTIPVKGICIAVFRNNISLTSVTLPDTINSIGDDCFNSCTSLQTINLPKDLTEISSNTFGGCSRLETVTIPAGAFLATIGRGAFEASGLTSMTIPATVTQIDLEAFKNCEKLATLTFESGSQLATIGEKAFYDCRALTGLTLPKAVKTLGPEAFSTCPFLTNLTFESGSQLETIGEKAFSDCRSLTGLVLPKTVKTIAPEAFSRCQALVSLTFESDSQLETIGTSAFSGCRLTALDLPASVMTIGSDAFACNELTQLTLNSPPSASVTIGYGAFMGNAEFSLNLLTTITLPANIDLPDDLSMGLYGSTFKSFYESTEAGGNNSNGGTFVYDTTTQKWSKKTV